MIERRSIRVRGVVQGVGFRPFVYRLATQCSFTGFVQNRAGTVLIEVEGCQSAMAGFLRDLQTRKPPLARIDELQWQCLLPRGEPEFRIEISEHGELDSVFVSPDIATCDDCLRELFDPRDRRHRYPFLNCTNCGPRLTIIQAAPYDRARTTMAGFAMCAECRTEYEDSGNRRLHAEPTCCPACGPRLALQGASGKRLDVRDPLRNFAQSLLAGHIGALKGLGGYHLACDARSETAVSALRRRKHRDEKPFAVMVGSLAIAERFCLMNRAERELLTSPRRPIVLLRKRAAFAIAEQVAPGNPFLGVMLPYTPLHHLLLKECDDVPLVMTSGNRADEPIAIDDADALDRLSEIADVFLTHDRPIRVRCDDSVTRVIADAELPLRRSRGYAPEPLPLPCPCKTLLLAVGGQLKGTFALGRDAHAFVSHHLGDLDEYAAYEAFVRDIDLYEQLFAVRPATLVHDLHPDYASTRYAWARAERNGLPTLAVQHHHAHMASCMAEHGLHDKVIGVCFDGTGLGSDGAIWGGEFLVGDYRSFHRAAHLRYVPMPGGDQAVREPWRMALAHLLDAGLDESPLRSRIDATSLRGVRQMLDKNILTPPTSSAGRLFDAVAALAGVRQRVSYEGQAAIELEWQAESASPVAPYDWHTDNADSETQMIDTRPLIRGVTADVAAGMPVATTARRFHDTLVEIIVQTCVLIGRRWNVNRVVLSGGVFMNRLLTEETRRGLQDAGLKAFRHGRVPANDGGLSFGQLAIAAAQL